MQTHQALGARFLSVISSSALKLGASFADNAVLQRELPVPVWG